MAIDEVRMRLRRKLEEAFGMEEADMLMDRPAGGWGDVVTNASIRPTFDGIDHRFEAIDRRFEAIDRRFDGSIRYEHKIDTLRFELRSEMDRGFRDQTWRLMTAIFASTGTLVAAFGAFIAVVKL